MLPNVAISGPSGSGKSLIARHLVAAHGYQRLSPGDICREITQLAFGSTDKTTLNKVNDAFRAIDESVWIKACLRQSRPAMPIVFDSIRFMTDWEFFRRKRYLLVRVTAPLDLRTKRLHSRGQDFLVGVDDLYSGETELDGAQFDKVISNTFAESTALLAAVDDWVATLRG